MERMTRRSVSSRRIPEKPKNPQGSRHHPDLAISHRVTDDGNDAPAVLLVYSGFSDILGAGIQHPHHFLWGFPQLGEVEAQGTERRGGA